MNNIPQFLEHLPIWKVNLLDKVKPKNVKTVKAHQYDVVDKVTNKNYVKKVCPICGKEYKVPYRLRNISKTCSGSCGQKMRIARKEPDTWIDEAVALKKQGFKLSDIALRVNRATSTVWRYLKKRGY